MADKEDHCVCSSVMNPPCHHCEAEAAREIDTFSLPGHKPECRYPELTCRCGEKPVDGPFNKIGDLPARRGTWRRFGPAPLEDVIQEINQNSFNDAFIIVKRVEANEAESGCGDPNLAMKIRDAEGLAEHGHRPVPWPSDVTPEPKKDEPTTHDLPEETLSTIARAFR